MSTSNVVFQQHQGVKIRSDVCFSGGKGNKPRGLLTHFLLSHLCLFNNPRVSAPANSNEAKPEEVKVWLEAGLTRLEEIAAEENHGG